MALSKINQRRLQNFKSNRRAWWSFWILFVLFILSMFAELIANDKPILVKHDKQFFMPVFFDYTEKDFGGEFQIQADYTDPYIQELIAEKGFALWPLIRFSYRTIDYDLEVPAPSAPSLTHILGTDDQARDVFARILYGFRLSVLFGLILTILSSLIGILAGAVQGYFGGRLDLLFQRFIEVWEGLPQLYLIIIMAAFFTPSFWMLLLILLLFSWTSLVAVVRAEFLRARKFEYIRAARALGVRDMAIMYRHILPNAMVATLTFLPFILSGSVVMLTSLDYLGFGLPVGSPSLGELLAQGRNNINAPWLGISGFVVISLLLSLMVFIGEGVRDAFDPRKVFQS